MCLYFVQPIIFKVLWPLNTIHVIRTKNISSGVYVRPFYREIGAFIMTSLENILNNKRMQWGKLKR